MSSATSFPVAISHLSPHISIQTRPPVMQTGCFCFEEEGMQPVHLRTATGVKSCANCIMYKSLDDYKNLIRQFGPGSPLVTAYGYGPEYLQKDGICEMEGDPPVMRSDICDNFLSF
jgi:hypothetical protein